jgi:hypothetical protein
LGHFARPGCGPERGFLEDGQAEVGGRKPLVCQALCRWVPPVSSQLRPRIEGVGSPIGPCQSRVECAVARRGGPSVIKHNPAGGTHGAHPERTQSLPITVLCFSKDVMQTLQFGGKNCSKSLTALGKKLSMNSQIAPLRTQQSVDAVSTPTCTGRPAWKISSRRPIGAPTRWPPDEGSDV